MTAYVVKAVRRFKNNREEVPANLTPEELAHAKTLWIKSAQWQLVSQKDFSTQQKQFNLFPDKKMIWCCGGRRSNMEAPSTTEHPILLP